MKTDIKPLPKSQLLITIEVTPEELIKYEDQAATRISQNVDIPGFRPGQAPKAFVISRVGPEAFSNELLNTALPALYFEAIKEKKVEVISRPLIKILSRSPLKFEAQVALLPQVILKDREKITVPEEEATVGEKEIDEVVAEMRRYKATYKPLTRPIEKGDRIEINFQGFDEGGVALEKTKSLNHPLFVGEGSLVAGFEDQLLGMKIDEKKKFPVVFPKDYHYEPLRGKTVHFETEVKKGEEVILPEINEQFIAEMMGEAKPLPEFRSSLKTNLEGRKKMELRKNRENKLLETFVDQAEVEVPTLLIDEEVEYMMADMKQQVESRGLSFETYLKKLEEEKRDIRKEHGAEAEKRIKLRLVLNYLFRELKLEVSDDEMKQASDSLIAQTPEKDRAGVTANLAKKGELHLRLRNNLMLEKLFAKFLK